MAKYLKSVKFPNSDTTYKIAEEQYNPDSEYAQSGKAVAEALQQYVSNEVYKSEVDNIHTLLDNKVDVDSIDQTYSPTSANAQSGKAVAEAVDPRTVYQKFIDDNNLKSRNWVDLSFVGGEYYYTDFLQAVADVNADTTVNSTTDSTNAVCQIFKNEGITVLRLLSDLSVNSNILFTKSVILDVNGYTVSCSGSKAHFGKLSADVLNIDFIIYGSKNNSTINSTDRTQMFAVYTKNFFILGGNYSANAIAQGLSTICIYKQIGKVNVEIYNANINMHSEVKNAVTSIYCSTDYPATIKLFNTKITTQAINHSYSYGVFVLEDTTANVRLEIFNSDISAVGIDDGDRSSIGILLYKAYTIIKNSKIYGITSGIENHSILYLQNCKCYSPYHGGVYNSTDGFLYAENCEFHRSVCPDGYTPTGWAASYFGYGSIAYIDGCSFILDIDGDTYDGIAIKQGSGTIPTKVFISNSELPKLRCDSGQYVYLGEGISDTIRNTTVNGTKVLTDENYSTYINKETGQPVVDIEYEPTSRSPQSGIAVKKAVNDATIEITNSEIDDICNTVIQPASEVLL